ARAFDYAGCYRPSLRQCRGVAQVLARVVEITRALIHRLAFALRESPFCRALTHAARQSARRLSGKKTLQSTRHPPLALGLFRTQSASRSPQLLLDVDDVHDDRCFDVELRDESFDSAQLVRATVDKDDPLSLVLRVAPLSLGEGAPHRYDRSFFDAPKNAFGTRLGPLVAALQNVTWLSR